jgi:hypothetical protein
MSLFILFLSWSILAFLSGFLFGYVFKKRDLNGGGQTTTETKGSRTTLHDA